MTHAEVDAKHDTAVKDARRKFRKGITDIPSVSSNEAYRINTLALELETAVIDADRQFIRDTMQELGLL